MSSRVKKMATLLAVLSVFGVAACSRTGSGGANSNIDYWTCTMHPSVHAAKAGKCPICGMELVPVTKQSPSASPATSAPAIGGSMQGMAGMPGMQNGTQISRGTSREFIVPVERQQQIGVTYARVERKPLEQTIRAVGTVVPNKARNWQFVSRVDGYVQKLHVTSPGEIVEKDAPLLSIYSPDLFTTEREFVELLRMRDQAKSKEARETPERLIQSARRRLQLWNVTDEQIAEIEKTRKAADTLTLLSPFRGVIQSVPVEQGKGVKVGDMLVEVADLGVVWVWVDFYENELSMLQIGQRIDLSSKVYPGKKFEGTISLINPFIDEAKRTAKVRIDIANPDFELRPGMYVNAEVTMKMGEGLTVPVSAIMPTGTRSVVFVNKGSGRMEPRSVHLGSKYGDRYEVQSGLQENENVVASANFLIDAESKVQGALKQFEAEPSTATP